MMLSIGRADELMARFPQRRVLVVGDLMLDRYVSGSVERISPEAPVPVVRVRGERDVAGGASNVAANVRAMGGRAGVCGALGRDAAGDTLRALLRGRGVDTRGIIVPPGFPTSLKTRIVADRQQVVRVDREEDLDLRGATLAAACARIEREAARADGIVIEDYGKGFVVQPVVDAALRAASRNGIPCTLDPKDNHELRVRGIAVATPNRKEAFVGAQKKDPGAGPDPLKDRALLAAGRALMERWQPEHLVITLGPLGMLLLARGDRPRHVPTRAREVFDVSGAGDTVIAVLTLALAAGADHVEAAEIANYAAGVVVGKMGTATCTPEELRAHLQRS